MEKKYYALYAPYGIQVAYGDYHCPTVHTFATRADRDKWVADDNELKRETCTATEARRWAKYQH